VQLQVRIWGALGPKSRVKVLFIVPNIPFPPTDGGRVVIYHTIRSVAQAGHNVAVVGMVAPGECVEREFAELYAVWSYESDQRAKLPGLLRSLFHSTPYSYAKCQPPGFAETVSRAADTFRPDLVHVDTLHVGTFGLSLKRKLHLPVVLRLLNVDSVLMSRFRDSRRNPLVRAYAGLQARRTLEYESRYLPEFSRCVAITETDAQTLRSITGVGVTAITAGVDTSFYAPRPELEEPEALVSTALMRWLPNVVSVRWLLDRVFPLVKREAPKARLFVVGKDPPADIRARTDGSSLVVTGFVPDVRPWVARGSVFLVPTRVGSGMRIKVLEALAMGKAVVSTRLGCEGIDGLKDDVNVLFADEPADFACAVVQLMNDPGRRRRLGEAGRELVLARYQWRNIAREFTRVYEQAASAKTGSESCERKPCSI